MTTFPYYEQLQPTQYHFGSGGRAGGALAGLKKHGPLRQGDCPAIPRILFVFADEYRNHANRLFLALKNGIGPFRGVDSLFKFTLQRDCVVRVKSFSIDGRSTSDAAHLYRNAIEEFIASGEDPVDLAFLIHPKTDRWIVESPYIFGKYELLKANVPTQSVTVELIDTPDLFQWSVANIALAAFAKMGGTPWAISTGLSEDSLVVGINRELISDPTTGRTMRWWGFATVFAHDGVFQGTTLFPPASTRNSYLRILGEAISSGIATWRERVGTPTNLIVHVRREIRREEIDVIEGCMEDAGASLVRSYAIVRLSDHTGMLIFDPSDRNDKMPPSGVTVMMSPYRAILQVAGREDRGQAVGRIIGSEPLQVRRERATDDAPPLAELCAQVVGLSSMNWRGLNAEATPVSSEYPREVASLLGRFDRAGLDIAALRDVPNLSRAWFL